MKRRRALIIESDLPEALRSLASQLSMQLSFEKALENLASSDYASSPEFSLILADVRRGAGLKEALSASAERVDSITYKRAMNNISSLYTQGSSSDSLKMLSDDLLSQQLSNARRFSSRLALASLLFIAVACIVPSLLLAYLLVGSSFLSLSVEPLEIWLLFLVLFPLFDLSIIAYISLGSPFKHKQGLLPPPLSTAEFTCLGKAAGINPNSLKCRLSLLFFACLFISLLSIFYNQPVLAIVAFLLPFVYYFHLHYLLQRRTDELERYLPDALLQASSLERGGGIEQMLNSLSTAGYGLLSEEFAQVRNSVRGGSGIPSALESMARRNHSSLLQRSLRLISEGYSLGNDAYSLLKEAADDMLSVFSLMRERSAAFSLQKYSLRAGAVLVPLILGTLLGAILGLDLSFSLDGAPNQSEQIQATVADAAPAYVLIYSLLSALLIAQIEGGWRHFLPYALALAPLSLFLFHLARTYPLFSSFA